MSAKAKLKKKQQQRAAHQQQPAPQPVLPAYYSYFGFESPKRALGFRTAQQPETGLWNVYAAMEVDTAARKRRERRVVKERLRTQDPERAATLALSDDETSEELRKIESPPHAKSNERLVVSALRSLAMARRCVEYCEIASTLGGSTTDGGEGARNVIVLWQDFQERMLRERTDAGGTARPFPYKWPTESMNARAQHLMTTDMRTELLETFGTVALARRDIKAFELLEQQQTILLYVHVDGLSGPLFAKSFDVSQREAAERTLEAWRRKANAQRIDPTLDMEDREPLPVEQRRRERKEAADVDTSATAQVNASANIDNVTLDKVKSLHDEKRELEEFVEEVERKLDLNGTGGTSEDDDDDDDEDADRDDKKSVQTTKKKKRSRDDDVEHIKFGNIDSSNIGKPNGKPLVCVATKSAAAAYMDKPPLVVTAKKDEEGEK